MDQPLDISFTTLRSESPNKSPEAVRKPAGGYLETATNASRKTSRHPPRFSSTSSSSSSSSSSWPASSSFLSSFLSLITVRCASTSLWHPSSRRHPRSSSLLEVVHGTTHLLFDAPVPPKFRLLFHVVVSIGRRFIEEKVRGNGKVMQRKIEDILN